MSRRFLWGLAALLLVAGTARSGFVINIDQVGGDVVATGSGFIDLTGLPSRIPSQTAGGILSQFAAVFLGPAANTDIDVVPGATGPSSFGSGALVLASSGFGDLFGIRGQGGLIVVPAGYMSGDPLSGTATFAGETLSSLSLIPGTYTFTLPADTITVQINPAPVPEPASLTLLGLGVAGLLGYRLRRRAT
jgi:hypothetical protein